MVDKHCFCEQGTGVEDVGCGPVIICLSAKSVHDGMNHQMMHSDVSFHSG